MTRQCCACRRVDVDGEWLATLGSVPQPVSHTYCPECFLQAELALFSAYACRVSRADAYTLGRWLRPVTGSV